MIKQEQHTCPHGHLELVGLHIGIVGIPEADNLADDRPLGRELVHRVALILSRLDGSDQVGDALAAVDHVFSAFYVAQENVDGEL